MAPSSVTVPSQFSVSVTTAASSGLPFDLPLELPLELTMARNGGPLRGGPPVSATWALVLFSSLALFWTLRLNSGWLAQITPLGRFITVALLLLVATMAMSSCSAGGSKNAQSSVSGTPAGSYTLMLTGTTASTTSNVALGLTVH
jgi:hypothetical protein